MSTITTAANQYANRPKDERYPSLGALIDAAEYDRTHSAELIYNLRDLRAQEATDAGHRRVQLASPKGTAEFTHYSFGQLARTIGAPAAYLRTLPADVAADAINFGLHEATPHGTTANLLVKANGGAPVIRAATSESYGRVWDASLYRELARHFGDGQRSTNGDWQSPPTWNGEPAGQYRGDRDSFVIRIDGGSIVTDPSASGGSTPMYRGLMVRNSEVGHCAISVECVLYRYICGNHMLWGAIMDRRFKRRHVGNRVTFETMREISRMAYQYNQRSASQDEQIVRSLIDHQIASTPEGVIDELRAMGATKEQATAAYGLCESAEPNLNPRSFWGIAQGFTRASQESGYQDERLKLDQLAAAVLKKGTRQYATV